LCANVQITFSVDLRQFSQAGRRLSLFLRCLFVWSENRNATLYNVIDKFCNRKMFQKPIINVYIVSQKIVQNCFCQNFVKFASILIIFDRKMAKRLTLCEVHSFSTSPNSRHRTTLLNADFPDCMLHNAESCYLQ